MSKLRRLPIVAVLLLSASTARAIDQEAVGAGALPPIASNYRAVIDGWTRTFFAEPRALRNPLVSDPVLVRDTLGRLLWLICLQVENPLSGQPPIRPEVHAFGFAPSFVTAPLQRAGSTLNAQSCTERQLVYRPFRGTGRR